MYINIIEYKNHKRNKKSNPGLYESGFENPFDDIDDTSTDIAVDIDDPINKYIGKNKGVSISKIGLWNSNVSNKILCRNNRVYANKYFCKGDVVEECPIKLMSKKDLYSDNIRDCVFPLDDSGNLYGLPLGYAVCYRNSKDAPVPANVTYYYDESSNMLVFTATSNIKKGCELVIDADDDDFANELHPSQFNYEPGYEPIYKTKDYRII